MLQKELLYALLGTGFTCGATILGAAMVFFFRKELSHNTQKVFLGFAAGVMIAASVWSLLIPAMEMAEEQGQSAMLAAGGGFLLALPAVAIRAKRYLPPSFQKKTAATRARSKGKLIIRCLNIFIFS